MSNDSQPERTLSRGHLLLAGLGAAAAAIPMAADAAVPPAFEQWRDRFRARATARGVSDQTYTRVMGRIEPDMSVFVQIRKQPEFNEQLWQYINRRVSDWRLTAGKAALQKYGPLFARIERDFRVERGTLARAHPRHRQVVGRRGSRDDQEHGDPDNHERKHHGGAGELPHERQGQRKYCGRSTSGHDLLPLPADPASFGLLRLEALLAALGTLAGHHAALPMAARTYGQLATPTSFGAVVAGWGWPAEAGGAV